MICNIVEEKNLFAMERILDWFVISEIFKEFATDLPCLCKSYNQRKNGKSRERGRATYKGIVFIMITGLMHA